MYSWVAAGLRPFTIGEEVMVAIPALVVFAAAWRPTRPPPPVRSSRASVALWLGLVILAVGWELFAFFSSPRDDHPTLSVITDEIMSVHAGRAVALLVVAHARLALRQDPTGEAPMTTRTITFVGYGVILALIILLATVSARRANWMSMLDALNALTRQEDGADLGGGGLDMARLALVRQGQWRVQVSAKGGDRT